MTRYVTTGLRTVPGWFEEIDAELFFLANDARGQTCTTGDLMDIGVYKAPLPDPDDKR